ncbi:hypothetical protein F3Y22_tig00110177pilonHSYRG00051 [Hibiscus syriacus]|uniref:Pectinesterase inhibitor domain-containing protein n=1 Tax=Hibiscus syriacus TaxID=106335 RepID=A0A6A3BE21_HIBSY|nr:hypothetical protein F3Y22_tig00110177pilonHSYRG00051 [Hibiscus syriacus]
MTPQTHFILVFTLFFLFLNVFSSRIVSVDQQIVAKVCSGTAIKDSAGCLKTLSSPQATAAKNIKQLVQVVMTEGATRAQKTLTFIEEMTNKENPPTTIKALKTCSEVYRHCIEDFKLAAPELSKDVTSANYDVSLIGPEVDKCAEPMEAASLNVPELVQGNHDLRYYASLGYGMTVKL